jgi:hypothetical protein
MESTLRRPALVAARSTPHVTTIARWTFTALFCLQIGWRRLEATRASA